VDTLAVLVRQHASTCGGGAIREWRKLVNGWSRDARITNLHVTKKIKYKK